MTSIFYSHWRLYNFNDNFKLLMKSLLIPNVFLWKKKFKALPNHRGIENQSNVKACFLWGNGLCLAGQDRKQTTGKHTTYRHAFSWPWYQLFNFYGSHRSPTIELARFSKTWKLKKRTLNPSFYFKPTHFYPGPIYSWNSQNWELELVMTSVNISELGEFPTWPSKVVARFCAATASE